MTKKNDKSTKEDFIVISDGCCPKCGKKIPDPIDPEKEEMVMCDCSIWFVKKPSRKIICHDCMNLVKSGRQIRCKVCNIRVKLEHAKYSCILHDSICSKIQEAN